MSDGDGAPEPEPAPPVPDAGSVPDRHDPFQALRHREFRSFLFGFQLLTIATQVQTAVLGWQVYALTGDPLSLGLVGLAEAVPFLALTLYGGHLADVRDRRRICILSQGMLTLTAVGLFALNLHGPVHSTLPLYAAQVLGGIARAFFRPANQALAADLVPREAYANASTWRSGLFHVAMVLGPAAGGLLIQTGYAVAYGVQAALMLLGSLFFFAVKSRPLPEVREAAGVAARLKEGIVFVFKEKVVLGALSLDLFAVLFGGAPALLPIFARDILNVGEVGYGWLRAAPALGSVVMSGTLAFLPPMQRAGRNLLVCVGLFGACWIAFALSRSYVLSLALLALSGAFDNVSVVLRSTLIQSFTPRELMGRVSAVNSFFIGSSNEVGAFESGVTARLLGTVASVFFGGVMTLVVVGMTAWRVPALRRLRQIR
ncbi:MAG: MFS transporter [Holophagaceae bacterium]|nr:MFS transporter [Holophagaceae bacterium]